MIMDFSRSELRLRKVLCSFGMLSMVLFASCEKDDVMKEVDSDSSQEKKEESSLNYRALFSTDHKIGVAEAKELALDASSLFSKDDSGLKSGRARAIGEVRALRSEETTLRSGSGDEVPIPDTLAYVCNFADSAGFAIICADDRVGCPILAYVGEGALGDEVDNPGLAMVLSNMEDYLIGSIRQFEAEKDSLRQKAEAQLQDDTTCLKRVYTGKYDLISNESVAPLICTKWHQQEPYNIYAPVCSGKKHMLAGCVAIATAQMLAYYEYPKSIDGYSFDWKGMKVASSAGDSKITDQNRISIARLVRIVGNHVGVEYGCEGSSANPNDVLPWLELYGYQAYSPDYTWGNIKSSLDARAPVMMYGCRIKTEKKKKFLGIPIKTYYEYSGGHVWLIDGYKTTTIKNYTYTTNTDTGVTANKHLSTSYSNTFLKINWGWGGLYDDEYYALGCFNPGVNNYQYEQKIYIIRR